MSKRVKACKNQNIHDWGLKPERMAWSKRFFARIKRKVLNDEMRRDLFELDTVEFDPDGTMINRGARWKR